MENKLKRKRKRISFCCLPHPRTCKHRYKFPDIWHSYKIGGGGYLTYTSSVYFLTTAGGEKKRGSESMPSQKTVAAYTHMETRKREKSVGEFPPNGREIWYMWVEWCWKWVSKRRRGTQKRTFLDLQLVGVTEEDTEGWVWWEQMVHCGNPWREKPKKKKQQYLLQNGNQAFSQVTKQLRGIQSFYIEFKFKWKMCW